MEDATTSDTNIGISTEDMKTVQSLNGTRILHKLIPSYFGFKETFTFTKLTIPFWSILTLKIQISVGIGTRFKS